MAVNDSQMLPAHVRTMRQMADLLQAEQVLFDGLEQLIADISRELDGLVTDTVTKEKLEAMAKFWSGVNCEVEEYPEELRIRLVFQEIAAQHGYLQTELLDIIPAHLQVLFGYKVSFIMPQEIEQILVQIRNRILFSETMTMEIQKMRSRFVVTFPENVTSHGVTIQKNLWFLNGVHKLDGKKLLNAKEYREDY
jgi:hypothetical protein